MKLYEYTMAPNPRRVRIFLAEKGVEIDTVQVDIPSGENLAPEFRAINPRSLLPTLDSFEISSTPASGDTYTRGEQLVVSATYDRPVSVRYPFPRARRPRCG